MDNYPIKSVAFGGFDKQDVIRYIEQTAEQSAAAQKVLREENDSLRAEADALRKETASLRAQLEESSARQAQLQSELAQETAARLELEKLKPLEEEVSRLKQEVDALRPDAEAYAQFRERIGAIECEARNRGSASADGGPVPRSVSGSDEHFRNHRQSCQRRVAEGGGQPHPTPPGHGPGRHGAERAGRPAGAFRQR